MSAVNSLAARRGDDLHDLLVSPERRALLEAASRNWPSLDLTQRQMYDLELLLNGAFSPVRGFMGRVDYESVCQSMRLSSGTLWPLPITLDVSKETARMLGPGKRLALRDPEGTMLALCHVADVWQPDRMAEAKSIYGSTDVQHPVVAELLEHRHPFCVGGQLEGIQLPIHYDFHTLRLTPVEARATYARLGWQRIAGVHAQVPLQRKHIASMLRIAEEFQMHLLLRPSMPAAGHDKIDPFTLVRCYQATLPYYPPDTAMIALLPTAVQSCGARGELLQALMDKNYGCTHVFASNKCDDTENTLRRHIRELGLELLPSYLEPSDPVADVSGIRLREQLNDRSSSELWLPEVVEEIRSTYPPRSEQGFTILLTGLSGAGKSTIANVLLVKFRELGRRSVTLLDGDIVRKHLSSELGFSKEHRNINIRRIGFVASEITKNRGIAICAPIAPYDMARKEVRAMIQPHGGFVLVYLSTPLEVCERRDRKGLYAKARAGIVPSFTGISDVYEPPRDAEIVINTEVTTPEQAVQQILTYLELNGYITSTDSGRI
jgi:sulfate adenylyltransferase